ncbi:MAG: glycosyltransferase [Candidatus Aenigmarchaeota archaeon]|nr:glycosyltransferase [Candidatus Aenigmarchaeota archaeon]
MKKYEISFLIPAFNEEMNIKKVLGDIDSVSRFLGLRKYEMIVVNDGSTDNTKIILESLQKKFNVIKIINFEKNRGYADAFKEGFRVAKCPLIFCTDADGQCNIKELKSLLNVMEKYNCDLVFGYRNKRKDSVGRILISYVFNRLSNNLFSLNLRDINCPFKLFKKRVLDNIQIKSKGFLVDLELATKAKKYGFVIKQTPVTHYPRRAGKSKFRLRTIFETFYGMLKLRKELGSL